MILQNDFVIGLANNFMAPEAAWILALVCIGAVRGDAAGRARSRQAAGLRPTRR